MKTAFLDTNTIVRYITGDDPKKMKACYKLLRAPDNNEITLVTSETIIAEVVYVLGSRRLFHLVPEEIAKRLLPILSIPGLKLEHREAIKRALLLFSELKIDFEDCLSVAHMERQRLQTLYSYDQHFDRVEQVTRLEP